MILRKEPAFVEVMSTTAGEAKSAGQAAYLSAQVWWPCDAVVRVQTEFDARLLRQVFETLS